MSFPRPLIVALLMSASGLVGFGAATVVIPLMGDDAPPPKCVPVVEKPDAPTFKHVPVQRGGAKEY